MCQLGKKNLPEDPIKPPGPCRALAAAHGSQHVRFHAPPKGRQIPSDPYDEPALWLDGLGSGVQGLKLRGLGLRCYLVVPARRSGGLWGAPQPFRSHLQASRLQRSIFEENQTQPRGCTLCRRPHDEEVPLIVSRACAPHQILKLWVPLSCGFKARKVATLPPLSGKKRDDDARTPAPDQLCYRKLLECSPNTHLCPRNSLPPGSLGRVAGATSCRQRARTSCEGGIGWSRLPWLTLLAVKDQSRTISKNP